MKRVPLIVLFMVASVLACGPFTNGILPVETVVPGDLAAYTYRGELGVVRPRFARRYLVQAFRRMSGHGPLSAVAHRPPMFDQAAQDAHEKWEEVYSRVAGSMPPATGMDRIVDNYQYIVNCLGSAYATAAQTLSDRAHRYGAASSQLREWIKAQDAVFHNCSDKALIVPDPPPASADPLERGDRNYQIAAAYFYAMRYDEAVPRFRQIASDRTSPWRAYGHYLAARALLRQAVTAPDLDRARLAEAEAEFRVVLQDPGSAFLHVSTRGLLDRIALHTRPMARLRVLSTALSSARETDDDTLRDYEYLMNAAVGDVTVYDYDKIPNRVALAATAEMNDWITVMQGEGPAATARAVAQWTRTHAVPWLAAALWKATAKSADAPALLEAAGRVEQGSPAFFTIAFLRVRLLALRGGNDEARAILETLPSPASPSGQMPDVETLNLLNALRLKLARSMDELLVAAPRHPLRSRYSGETIYADDENGRSSPRDPILPVFDDDAGAVFSARLPLARLVEAAKSSALPARLRRRVAAAAFARAWMLKRDDEALVVAPILRDLSPSLAADMSKFEAASTAQDRHIAGLRLLLRTPGLHANVTGIEDDEEYDTDKELSRSFDSTFRRNWWCGIGPTEHKRSEGSQTIELLYSQGRVPYPAFLSTTEVAAVEEERTAINLLGPAPNYLAAEAVKWAKARPADLDAAEALTHAVQGTRWGCTDNATSSASRAAFQALHRLFPQTEWARKTKYWY